MSAVKEDMTEKYQVALEESVDEMRRLAKKKPRVTFLGKEFLIYPEVFHPGPWIEILAYINEEVIEVVKNKLAKKSEDAPFHFLEVGCGAGYTGIHAALFSQKCKVWATDINPVAVKNTTENAKLRGVDDRLTAVTADVFDHKEIAGKKFDMIYWNFAWDDQPPEPDNELELLMRSLVDPGYQGVRRYLSQAGSFLKDSGSIFVAFSFTVGSKELFDKVVAETGWSYKVSSKKMFMMPVSGEKQTMEVSILEL